MATYALRSTATSTGTGAGVIDGGTLAIEGGAHIFGIAAIISSGTPATVIPIHANIKLTSDDYHDFEPCELPMAFSGSQLGTFTATPENPANGIMIIPVDIQVPSIGATFNCDINLVAAPSSAGKFQFMFLYEKGGMPTEGTPKFYGEATVSSPKTAGTEVKATEKLLASAKIITDLWILVSLVTPTATQDAQYIVNLSGDIVQLGNQKYFANQYPGATSTNAVTPSAWVHYKVAIPVVGGATITAAFDVLTTVTGESKAQIIIGYS